MTHSQPAGRGRGPARAQDVVGLGWVHLRSATGALRSASDRDDEDAMAAAEADLDLLIEQIHLTMRPIGGSRVRDLNIAMSRIGALAAGLRWSSTEERSRRLGQIDTVLRDRRGR